METPSPTLLTRPVPRQLRNAQFKSIITRPAFAGPAKLIQREMFNYLCYDKIFVHANDSACLQVTDAPPHIVLGTANYQLFRISKKVYMAVDPEAITENSWFAAVAAKHGKRPRREVRGTLVFFVWCHPLSMFTLLKHLEKHFKPVNSDA
ncbi:MAG: hypothetical protein ACPGR8_06380 [Limisphaerales bacterium]